MGHDRLVWDNSRLEEINSKYSLRLGLLESLDKMGFGFAELKQLRNVLCEIAAGRDMPTEGNAVVMGFIDSIRDHIDDYLDLGKTVQELKSKIQELDTQRDLQLVALNLTPDVKKEFDSLLRMGIDKNHIERCVKLVRQTWLSDSRQLESKNGDRTHVSQPTLAANHTIIRDQIKHWPRPPIPKRTSQKIMSRKRSRSGEQNLGHSDDPETQIYRRGVPSRPGILESSEIDEKAVRNPPSEQSEKPHSSRDSIQRTRESNQNPKVKLAQVDLRSFFDDAVTKPEVWKCSQLNEKRIADTQEVKSRQQPAPAAGKEQTRTDPQKEKSPLVDAAEIIDFGELIRNIYVRYLT